MLQPLVERILRARVYDVARETPLEEARRLSARLSARVLLKREADKYYSVRSGATS